MLCTGVLALIGFSILVTGLPGIVRAPEPDRHKDGFAVAFFGIDKAQCLVNHYGRRPAGEGFRLSVAAQHRVDVEEIGGGQPVVVSEMSGVSRVGCQYRHPGSLVSTQVPFPEMGSRIARFAKYICDGRLLQAHRPSDAEDGRPVVVAAGEYTGTGGGADGCPGIEMVHPESGGGHGIQLRGTQHRVSLIAGFPPALVVTHQQDDVRTAIGLLGESALTQQQCGQEQAYHTLKLLHLCQR